MQPETVKKVYKYYRCRTHTLDPADCPHILRIREDVLEDYLLREFEGIAKKYYSKNRRKKAAQSGGANQTENAKAKRIVSVRFD